MPETIRPPAQPVKLEEPKEAGMTAVHVGLQEDVDAGAYTQEEADKIAKEQAEKEQAEKKVTIYPEAHGPKSSVLLKRARPLGKKRMPSRDIF